MHRRQRSDCQRRRTVDDDEVWCEPDELNHQPPEHDRHKLRALTHPHLWFACWIGLFLVLGKKSVVSDVYVGTVIDKSLSAWLPDG
jgi:hypothetical protein